MDSNLRERMLGQGGVFTHSPVPLSFGDPGREAAAAISGCVAADRSDLGRVRMGGDDRADLLHRLSTNDVRELKPGDGTLTALLNTKGRVLDLLQVLARDSELLLITSPGRGEATRAWLEGYVFRERITLEASGASVCLGLYGPASGALLERLAGERWDDLPLAHHRSIRVAGHPIEVARSFPLAGSGYLLLGSAESALPLWEALTARGALPAGSDALERLRVAAGVPGWGKELSEEYNPWEAGLDLAVSLTKGCYLGQEIVARLHNYRKVQRRLAGIRLEGAPPPERSLVRVDEEAIGSVTSAAPSPDGAGSIALGIFSQGRIVPGLEVSVAVPGGESRGVVIPLPFTGAAGVSRD